MKFYVWIPAWFRFKLRSDSRKFAEPANSRQAEVRAGQRLSGSIDMWKPLLYLATFICVSTSPTFGANILGISVVAFKSANLYVTSIFEELVNKGHNLTVITSFPGKASKNYREIEVDFVDFMEIWDDNGTNTYVSMSSFYGLSVLFSSGYEITDRIFKSPQLQEFIKNDNTKFDLVISEDFLHEAFNMFAHKYQAPLIIVHTYGHAQFLNSISGNPLELAYTTHEFDCLYGPMNIWQKTNNALLAMYDAVFYPKSIQRQNKIAEDNFKMLSKPLPDVLDIQKNASIIFVNSHYTLGTPRPLSPHMIEVAGLQINPPKKLPQDLADLFDNSPHGVIYFSLGSIVKSTDLPKETVNMLLKFFSSLKQTVLWKWEDSELPGKPKNVFIKKWMPQNDILGHPNLKLFISHGGLQSTHETLYHGVPFIGIPFFGDHFRNLAKAKIMGYGEEILLENLNEDSLRSTVDKMLTDTSYSKKIKELSMRFKDQPQTSMEKCIYWIEYVIRHKGASFLKPPSVWMSGYEYYMIDVIALLLALLLLISINVWLFLKCLSNLFCKSRKNIKNKNE